MALKNSYKRISPLDLNKNVSIGVLFPLDKFNMHKGSETAKEQVKSDLINLVLTERGERIHLLNYGVGLKKYLFEQGNTELSEKVEQELHSTLERQIQYFLPQISLKNIFCFFDERKNQLIVKIVYVYTLDNTEDAIQLNFKK